MASYVAFRNSGMLKRQFIIRYCIVKAECTKIVMSTLTPMHQIFSSSDGSGGCLLALLTMLPRGPLPLLPSIIMHKSMTNNIYKEALLSNGRTDYDAHIRETSPIGAVWFSVQIVIPRERCSYGIFIL